MAMCPSPLKESNHLRLAGEMLLEFAHRPRIAPIRVCSEDVPPNALPAKEVFDQSGACPDSARDPLLSDETLDALTAKPPRTASRASCSSRSASPAISGRAYTCRQCAREYASTDAVRKHCRMMHPEWLRDQGQGCPNLYCTPVVASPGAIEGPVLSGTPQTLPPVPGTPSDDPSALFGAAESFLAFSKAAVASSALTAPAPATVVAAAPSPIGSTWCALPAGGGRGSNKRPRSVRCGQCQGCVRDDCGECKNCVDKPKFGGLGQRKQGCIAKMCKAPRVGA